MKAEIEDATRDECASLVPPGFNHNCYTDEVEFGPIHANPGPTKSGSCIDSCYYINPPPFGGVCPDDPNPFECNAQDGEDTGGESDTTGGEDHLETGTDTTDGATTGVIGREVVP